MAETKIHGLKLHMCYADAVYMGDKTFEIRDNTDRGFQRGDRIMFQVVNNEGVQLYHPLNKEMYEITYVLPYYGLKDNYVALAIKAITGKEDDDAKQTDDAPQ